MKHKGKVKQTGFVGKTIYVGERGPSHLRGEPLRVTFVHRRDGHTYVDAVDKDNVLIEDIWIGYIQLHSPLES